MMHEGLMRLAELQPVIDYPVSVGTDAARRSVGPYRRQKQTAITRRLRLNTLGANHESTQICSIGHRAWCGRTGSSCAGADQAYRRHRDAHQILGALDR